MKLSVFGGNCIRLELSWDDCSCRSACDDRAWTGKFTDPPSPNLAYTVSDEGSISRFATSIPTYKTKQSLIWRRGWMREMSVLGLDLSRCYSELGLVFGSLRCSVEKDKHDSRCWPLHLPLKSLVPMSSFVPCHSVPVRGFFDWRGLVLPLRRWKGIIFWSSCSQYDVGSWCFAPLIRSVILSGFMQS